MFFFDTATWPTCPEKTRSVDIRFLKKTDLNWNTLTKKNIRSRGAIFLVIF